MPPASDAAPPEETFLTRDGLRLFVRIWRPAGPPRAVLAICPGFNSHSGQYFDVAAAMTAQGLAVYAIDLRGRGRSDGTRFFVERVEDYTGDLGALIDLAVAREGDLPVYLLGHSAGGVVSCTYALDHQERLAGLICESFAFRVPAPDFALTLIKGIGRLAPHLPVLRLHNRDFSRDPAIVAAMDADPLIAGETQPAATVAALARADDRLKQSFRGITLPVLILHGTADRATLPAGSRAFHAEAGASDKTLRLYEGHAHDLLNDVGRAQVLDDIGDWIDARLQRAAA